MFAAATALFYDCDATLCTPAPYYLILATHHQCAQRTAAFCRAFVLANVEKLWGQVSLTWAGNLRAMHPPAQQGAICADFDDEDFENLTKEQVEAIIEHGKALLDKRAYDVTGAAGTSTGHGQPAAGLYPDAEQIKVRTLSPSGLHHPRGHLPWCVDAAESQGSLEYFHIFSAFVGLVPDKVIITAPLVYVVRECPHQLQIKRRLDRPNRVGARLEHRSMRAGAVACRRTWTRRRPN